MNKRTGLVSFHLDVDIFEDEKIQFVSARFGTKGEAITIRLLCKIYRQGYYMDWNEDIALLFSKGAGDNVSPSCANEIVNELARRGFFDKSLLDRFSILTSRRIQRQYFEASKRRKQAPYNPDHILVDVSEWANASPIFQNANVLDENVYILSQNADILEQSKVKESKVNKNLPGTACADSGEQKPKEYDKDGIPYKCSKFLADKILQLNPNAKVPKDDAGLFRWCVHIDRLLRIDEKPPDELRSVLAFAVKDPFWRANILSTKNFREKYDQLYMKMKSQGGAINNGNADGGIKPGEPDPYEGIESSDF